MIGKGFFRECFQPRTCSGRKTSKSNQAKGNHINVVLIDIDCDQASDVVIIDEPELVQDKSYGSSVPRTDKKCPLQRVIIIDDDDSRNGGELDSDASSSTRFSHAQNLVHINVDDCHVVEENIFASNLPNHRQKFPAKDADRSRLGLDGSEGGSSESDCSDCELMEACEEWEKAWVKKKRRVVDDQAGYDEQPSSSGFSSTIYTDSSVENRTGELARSPVHSGPSNGKCVKENPSSFSVTGDRHINGTSCSVGTENSSGCFDHKVNQECFRIFRSGFTEETQSIHQNSDPQSTESRRRDNSSSCSNYRGHNFSGGDVSDSRFKKEMSGKESKFMGLNVDESARQVDNHGSTLINKNDKISAVHSSYASIDETHASNDGIVSQQSCDRWQNSGLSAEAKSGFNHEDSLFCNPQSLGKSRFSNCSQEVLADSGLISVHDRLFNDLQDKKHRCCLVENGKPSDVGDALPAVDNGITHSDDRDIINKRESLKETDEYKRTIEEEWASRKRQLQIQAEEAKRLRKRKKAESMRLLDMQRRQKERIEEVRETQKKDEENMNMKEKLRAEIMKGLNKLEMTCVDMASLLRCLGIEVGGGFKPSPHEVHRAYKQALLKFHPDRASKFNIRDQVEAEEKFKLISRMKEKLSTACF